MSNEQHDFLESFNKFLQTQQTQSVGRPKTKPEPKYRNTREFIQKFMEFHPLRLDDNGFFINKSGKIIGNLNHQLLEFYDSQDRNDLRYILKNDMYSFLDGHIKEFYEKELETVKNRISLNIETFEEDLKAHEEEYKKLQDIIFPQAFYSELERKKLLQLFHMGLYNEN